jgi:hypothetical protein
MNHLMVSLPSLVEVRIDRMRIVDLICYSRTAIVLISNQADPSIADGTALILDGYY